MDVDGSYLHRKQASSSHTDDPDPEQTPPVPLIGWECVDTTNVQNIPKVTHGKGIVFHAKFDAFIL